MSNIQNIIAAIAAGHTVRVPDAYIDSENALDESLGMSDATWRDDRWARHCEGDGYDLGVWQDADGDLWTLEYDPAGDSEDPVKLVWRGTAADVTARLIR